MLLPLYFIITLGGMLFILMIVRLFLRDEKELPMDIGKSMTIGNRQVQEDNYSTMVTDAGVLAVLADGMGRQFGGRIGSRIAVETFTELFKDYNAFDNPQYYFRKAFRIANNAILNAADEQRAGASVAAAMIRDGKLYYAVVGDVKIAVYRGNDLIPVSEGHTIDMLAQQEFRRGKITRQEAMALLDSHRLYNYLGQDSFRDVELFDEPLKLRSGDIVALMSDGIYRCIPWKELENIMSGKGDSQKKAFEIVERVNASADEHKDNASIVLVRV